MHEFKKKLLGTKLGDNDKEEKDILPDGQVHPQNPSHKSLSVSQKLEELRKAFQNELEQEDAQIQKKIIGKAPVDFQLQSLEKGLQDLRQAFRNEIVEKNNNPISSEYLHRIERRIEILKKRLDQDLPEDGPHIKVEDFQGLEKRLEILRKMFEIEFSKKAGIQDIEQNVTQLENRFVELTKIVHARNMDKEKVETLLGQFQNFQTDVKALEDRLVDRFESNLNAKVEKSELSEISAFVENLKKQNIFDFDAKQLLMRFSEVCQNFQDLDQKVLTESQRLNRLISELDQKVQHEFDKNTDARILVRDLRDLQEAYKTFESGFVTQKQQVEAHDEIVKKMQLQIFDSQERLSLLEQEFGKDAVSEIYQQFDAFKQAFKQNFNELSSNFAKFEDVQRLDKKIDLLRNVVDSEFSESTSSQKLSGDLAELKERVNLLQKSLKEELLNSENADDIASGIVQLQQTVIELQKKFSTQMHEKLDAKASAYELSNLEHQISELTLIVEQMAQSETTIGTEEILDKFRVVEERFELENKDILEKINFLKKTFQNEFDNNTDARLLAKNFRELQNRMNDFESENLNRMTYGKDEFEGKLREINEKFKHFNASLGLKIEDQLRGSSFYSQVQNLEQEIQKLKNQMQSLASRDSRGNYQPKLDTFDSLELLIEDFKKTVLVELNEKISGGEFNRLRADIHKQVDELRGKVQVALEHSENSKSLTYEIQELGQILVKVQKNEEDVRNQHDEIESISQDLNAFAIGLEELNAKIKSGEIRSIEDQGEKEFTSQSLAFQSLRNDFDHFKNEVFSRVDQKSNKKDFDDVLSKISSMFDALKKDVESQQHKDESVKDFSIELGQLEKKIAHFDEKINRVESETNSEIGKFKLDLESAVALQSDIHAMVSDIKILRDEHCEVIRELEGKSTAEEHQTVVHDIASLESDFKKLQRSFDVEFDKNTRMREVFDVVPEMQTTVQHLKEYIHQELAGKIDRKDFNQKLNVYDSKIETSHREFLETKSSYAAMQKKVATLQEEQKKSQKELKRSLVSNVASSPKYLSMIAVMLTASLVGIVIGVLFMQIQMKPKWESELKDFRLNSEKQIEMMMASPQIEQLINDKARIQTETQINNTFKRAIQIYVDLIKKKTDVLIADLETNSDQAVERLTETIEFSRLIAEAQAGKRTSFDQLLKISNNENSVLKTTAGQAIININNEISAKNSASVPMDLSERVFATDYATIDAFKKIYNAIGENYKPTLLLELWNSNQISKMEKIGFLISEIQSTESLILLSRAIELVDIEAALFQPLSDYETYLKWWDTNQSNYLPSANESKKSHFFF